MFVVQHIESAVSRTQASTISHVINKPSAALVGHYMILDMALAIPGNSQNVTVTAPTGWTLLGNGYDVGNGYSSRYLLYGKFIEASDPASWTFTFSSTVQASTIYRLFANVSPLRPVPEVSFQQPTSATTTRVTPSVLLDGDRYVIYGTVDRSGSDPTVPGTEEPLTKVGVIESGVNSLTTARRGNIDTYPLNTSRTFSNAVSTDTAVTMIAALAPINTDVLHIESGISNSTFYTTTNTHVVQKPAAVKPGMYMIIDLSGAVNGDSIDTTISTPAGWTVLASGWDAGAAASPKLLMYGKFITENDPSSWSFTAASNTNMLSHYRLFANVDTESPVISATYLAQGTAATTRVTPAINPHGPGYLIYSTGDRNGSDPTPSISSEQSSKLRSFQPSNVSLMTARGRMVNAFTTTTRTMTGGVSTGAAGMIAAFLRPAVWDWERTWGSGIAAGTTLSANNTENATHIAFHRIAKNSPANLTVEDNYSPKLQGFETETAALFSQPASTAVYGDIGISATTGKRLVFRGYFQPSLLASPSFEFYSLRNNVASVAIAQLTLINGTVLRAYTNNGNTIVGNVWSVDQSKAGKWLRIEFELLIGPAGTGYYRIWLYDEHSTTPFFANDPDRTITTNTTAQGMLQFMRVGWGGSGGPARNVYWRDMIMSTDVGPNFFYGPSYVASAKPRKLVLGDTVSNALAVGDTPVDRAYLGDTLLFQR